jgi:transposase
MVTVKVPTTHRHHRGVPLKSAKDRMDIISAYQQVGSYRAAAEMCGTTHKTVKRVVEKFEAGDAAPPRAERAHNYDAVTALVAERVKKSQGRMSAKRMLPIARAAGYDGSARNFRRLVAEAKLLWRNDHHRGRRPAVWSPGEYLVIDWAQAAPGLFLFCAVLAFSRWRFVAFATDQRASTTLALIAEAMGAIGGVPARVLADRMACLKGGVVANVVIPTADMSGWQAITALHRTSATLMTHSPRASWRTCAATPNVTWRCRCSPRLRSPGRRWIYGRRTPSRRRGVRRSMRRSTRRSARCPTNGS